MIRPSRIQNLSPKSDFFNSSISLQYMQLNDYYQAVKWISWFFADFRDSLRETPKNKIPNGENDGHRCTSSWKEFRTVYNCAALHN